MVADCSAMRLQACVLTFLDSFDEGHFHDLYTVWPRVAPSIITVYLIMVTLIMMNLLLARMGDTYNRISEQAELEWLLQRARVVRGIENEMTDEEREAVWNQFLVQDRSGRLCFQVQEVNAEYWTDSSRLRRASLSEAGTPTIEHARRASVMPGKAFDMPYSPQNRRASVMPGKVFDMPYSLQNRRASVMPGKAFDMPSSPGRRISISGFLQRFRGSDDQD